MERIKLTIWRCPECGRGVIADGGYNPVSHKDCSLPRLEDIEVVALADVVEALEHGYAPQNPSDAHPADYVTKRFKGEGHEGLEC